MAASQIEDISLQMRDMKIGPDDKDIAKVEESRQRTPRAHRNLGNNSRRYQDQLCSNCGFEAHLEGKSCLAYGKRCTIFVRDIIILQLSRDPTRVDIHKVTGNQVEATNIKGNIE